MALRVLTWLEAHVCSAERLPPSCLQDWTLSCCTCYAELQRDSSMTPSTDELIPASQASEVASTDMKKAAMQIAQQCLRRWDGALGIRPGTDAGGAKAGIWRRKFDGVRCAALLLAFQKFNKTLQMQTGRPGRLEATKLRLVFFAR